MNGRRMNGIGSCSCKIIPLLVRQVLRLMICWQGNDIFGRITKSSQWYQEHNVVFLSFYVYTMSFVLYVLAFIMVVIWGPALIVPKKFMKVVGGIMKNSDMVRMMSLRTMLIAFFFLAMYPLLKGGWLMIISILGRLMLIKSVVGLRFPGLLQKKFSRLYAKTSGTIIMGVISIVFAAFIVWVGLTKF